MASYLRPRRGKKATAVAQLTASAPLKRGEVFFEVPDAGTGTGAGKIKMGDGSTAYDSLPYFLEPFDPNSATVGFTNATTAESDPYTTNATHVNAIIPTANLKTIFTNLKQLLLNYNSQFTKLNNDLDIVNNSLSNLSNSILQIGFSSIAFSKEIITVEANKQKRTYITINGKLVSGVIMSVSAYGGSDNFLCKSSFLKDSETNAYIDLTCNIAGIYQVQYMMFLK